MIFHMRITCRFGAHNFLPRGCKQLLKPVSESSRHSLQTGHYITSLPDDDLKSASCRECLNILEKASIETEPIVHIALCRCHESPHVYKREREAPHFGLLSTIDEELRGRFPLLSQ